MPAGAPGTRLPHAELWRTSRGLARSVGEVLQAEAAAGAETSTEGPSGAEHMKNEGAMRLKSVSGDLNCIW